MPVKFNFYIYSERIATQRHTQPKMKRQSLSNFIQAVPKSSETEYNKETLVIYSKDKMSFEEQSSED